ncbi:ATP-binding cassette sub-family C member 4 [Elysia marginata]|uniref:ATP-binding cassette sub-family C member 4 n=1 Tax=Elysia marginata TaxID=1093978 RepID=A0AAV4EUV0_9GAST|nr:ATP-binding cassette sub-family C member 4 [Elysia marginata]
MVLDAGTIVEMDSPFSLLSQRHGAFYDMVEQLGNAELENLIELARAAALRHGDQLPPVVNGKGQGKPSELPQADGTLQDVTQSLENSSGDLDNTYKIEDIEESLTEAPVKRDKQREEEEDLDGSGSADERKQLLSDPTWSAQSEGRSDSSHKPLGPMGAAVDDEDEGGAPENAPDDTDESQSLLKSDGQASDSAEVKKWPRNGDSENDSINV